MVRSKKLGARTGRKPICSELPLGAEIVSGGVVAAGTFVLADTSPLGHVPLDESEQPFILSRHAKRAPRFNASFALLPSNGFGQHRHARARSLGACASWLAATASPPASSSRRVMPDFGMRNHSAL